MDATDLTTPGGRAIERLPDIANTQVWQDRRFRILQRPGTIPDPWRVYLRGVGFESEQRFPDRESALAWIDAEVAETELLGGAV